MGKIKWLPLLWFLLGYLLVIFRSDPFVSFGILVMITSWDYKYKGKE